MKIEIVIGIMMLVLWIMAACAEIWGFTLIPFSAISVSLLFLTVISMAGALYGIYGIFTNNIGKD